MTQQLQLLWYRERGWGDEWSWLHVVVISEWVSEWVAKMMRWANKPHREGMLAIGRRRRWVCTCCWGWCWGRWRRGEVWCCEHLHPPMRRHIGLLCLLGHALTTAALRPWDTAYIYTVRKPAGYTLTTSTYITIGLYKFRLSLLICQCLN